MTALLGSHPQGAKYEQEMLAHRGSIIKIDSNHFALNKCLADKEMFNKTKLEFQMISSLINLDYDKRAKFRIILEGGKLLCNFLKIVKERDSLLEHVKALLHSTVKNASIEREALDNLVCSVQPGIIVNSDEEEESLSNPILPMLSHELYKELKRVKELEDFNKDKEFVKKE